jgi:hypothetical protein
MNPSPYGPGPRPGSADKSDVSQCFQHGGNITLSMGDHSSYMTCQQVLALTQEIEFTVRLQC